jgi:hypothetical protein
MAEVTVKDFSLENSTVLIDGKSVYLCHSRLLSRDGKRLQKCRIHSASAALSDSVKAVVRDALNTAAEAATAQYRNLKNAQVAA